MGSAASTAAATARVWRPAVAPPAVHGADLPLTVATYNILADRYSGIHTYCPPEHLAWPRRKQRIVRELLSLGADILCLQEVERPFFEEELQPVMAQHGYEALYGARRRRPTDPPAVPEEGVSLLYRTERLERLDSKAVRFEDRVDPSLRGRFWQAVRARDDGVVLALLRDRETRRHLLAGCTHLFWDPRYPDVKAAQAQLLCRSAAAFLRQQPSLRNASDEQLAAVPVVIGGDFNSLPFKRHSDPFDTVPPGGALVSGVYSILSDPHSSSSSGGSGSGGGGIDSSHPDHPANRQLGGSSQPGLAQLRLCSAPLRLVSAGVLAWGREPPVTNRTATFSGTLDYVWLSRGHWAVGEVLALPYRFDPAPTGQPSLVNDPTDVPHDQLPPLPNADFASDHLTLAFRLHAVPPGGRH